MYKHTLVSTSTFSFFRDIFHLGGFASAVTAMRYPDKIAGLILLYPGFVLIEDLHRDFDTLDQIPDSFIFNKWFSVGRCFASDVWSFDPYSQIGKYKKPVLILHGDSDPLLPASWSLMAASSYPYPVFHVIKGGRHGFKGSALNGSNNPHSILFKKICYLRLKYNPSHIDIVQIPHPT